MSERPDHPWYQEGLRFECTACGDCCTGAPGFVWVNKAEIEALAATLGLSVGETESKYVRKVGIRKSLVEVQGGDGKGDCVFFNNKTRQCQVYHARPRQCHTWPFWQSNLQSPDAWNRAAESCPGCNRGPVFPVEEIERRVNLRKV